ncbi:MAG: pyruvate carboxylase [Gammaproteobacteria bacterium]
MKKIKRLLVANRGEIAIRVMRAATELNITTVALFSNEDRYSLHRFKADEAYQVGEGKTAVQAYLDIDDIIRIARDHHVDAIHPGYGFLSESPEFVDACERAKIIFVGPSAVVMRKLGNKVSARKLAEEANVPVMPASPPLSDDEAANEALAETVGYPVMLKASWGGGGRGMRIVENSAQLKDSVAEGRAEALNAFGNGEVYLEKLVRRARHVEVQVIGDAKGQVVHLFERDCTVQRRNQKIVERAPAIYLDEETRNEVCNAAVRLAQYANYVNAGTVEFLQDAETGQFYFIEVNPRVQVEHTVTEEITGIDIVQAQIKIAAGATIGADSGVPAQNDISMRGHAMQCRITTEDPENNFIPDYGTIAAYRSASGFGVRLDAGTAYAGAKINRAYDSLLVKLTTRGNSPHEVNQRMLRALREFRIRGVATNLKFLENLLSLEKFVTADYTTKFIDETPALFEFSRRRDRATRLLRYIGETIVNGNAALKGRPKPLSLEPPRVPISDRPEIPRGTKQILEEQGPEGLSKWLLAQKGVQITDTTFRDAHQSLLATRFRSHDLLAIAPYYAKELSQLFSLECWGGATFDVSMRFLNECPWERLQGFREQVPNVLLQMLLRASNGVGYKNYPDNVVRYFVQQAAANGVDVFRIFDSLNWTENMRVAIDAVCETGAVAEAAMCFTGNLSDPGCTKYDLRYYVEMAKELEKAGAHILAIKDMAGLCQPAAASQLVSTLKQEVGIPIHFHTHDTSGIAAASVLAAIDAGVDAVDAAVDAMSGTTSQPNMGSIVEAIKFSDRKSAVNPAAIRTSSHYWEHTRGLYRAFESDVRAGASEVYIHGMPGGQYTNLKEQARSLGIIDRWEEVAQAYADVNDMFGDIVKVTPSSKVVGDLALFMITSGVTRQDIEDPNIEVSFPQSVVSFFRGELGQPVGGFPKTLQEKVLAGESSLTQRPGELLAPVDLDAARIEVEQKIERKVSDVELASYLMYPEVFVDYAKARRGYGKLSVLPTSNYFYGMSSGEEITVEIDNGKLLLLTYTGIGDVHEDGTRLVFFELNGQPRQIKIQDLNAVVERVIHPQADKKDPRQIGAPMPGLLVAINVAPGDKITKGDPLVTIEAMKMQTSVNAEQGGEVEQICVEVGEQISTHDLLIKLA